MTPDRYPSACDYAQCTLCHPEMATPRPNRLISAGVPYYESPEEDIDPPTPGRLFDPERPVDPGWSGQRLADYFTSPEAIERSPDWLMRTYDRRVQNPDTDHLVDARGYSADGVRPFGEWFDDREPNTLSYEMLQAARDAIREVRGDRYQDFFSTRSPDIGRVGWDVASLGDTDVPVSYDPVTGQYTIGHMNPQEGTENNE